MCISVSGGFKWVGRDRYYDWHYSYQGGSRSGGIVVQHNYLDGRVNVYYSDEDAVRYSHESVARSEGVPLDEICQSRERSEMSASAAAAAAAAEVAKLYALVILAEQEQAVKDAEQLRLKSEMLTHETAEFASQGIYNDLLTATNTAITNFNAALSSLPSQDDIAAAQATLAEQKKDTGNAVDSTVAAIKTSAMIPILIVVGVLAVLYMFIFARRS